MVIMKSGGVLEDDLGDGQTPRTSPATEQIVMHPNKIVEDIIMAVTET